MVPTLTDCPSKRIMNITPWVVVTTHASYKTIRQLDEMSKRDRKPHSLYDKVARAGEPGFFKATTINSWFSFPLAKSKGKIKKKKVAQEYRGF